MYARNADGSLYLAEPDEATLKEIARITDGRYYRATEEKALDEIYTRILEMEKSTIEVKHFKQRRELAKQILPFAIFGLLAEVVLVATVWRRIP
jgi:Ca-activated chloride channel family protein